MFVIIYVDAFLTGGISMGILYNLIINFKKNNYFDEIYHFYEKQILFISKKFNIEEYQSDMFYNLWTIVKKIDLNILNTDSSINKYISKSLKNYAINYYRKKRHDNFIMYNTEVTSIEIDKHIQADFDDSILILKDILKNTLSDKQFNIINLRYFKCLSDIEIAKKLNISRQAVYKNRLLALSNIKKSLSI